MSAAIYKVVKTVRRGALAYCLDGLRRYSNHHKTFPNNYLLKINIVSKLHVLGVDSEDLESAGWVRNSDVNLSVEPAESSKGRVDRVGSVGGGHDDDVGSGLETVHKSEKLRDDSSLDLSVGLDR